jgi:hypothetical protein
MARPGAEFEPAFSRIQSEGVEKSSAIFCPYGAFWSENVKKPTMEGRSV